jgi:carboxypeptidase C (cathepsin A)
LSKLIPLLVLPLLSLFAEETSPIESAIKSLLEQFQSPKESDNFTITNHTIQLDSSPLSYKAVTGTLNQYTDHGEIAGKLFFTAYLKETEEKNRPVTFIFNGGPGASSLAMHIGGLGPKRLLLPEEGQRTLPPYQLVDNQETILDMTDIVMVDPIGSGYSETEQDIYKFALYGVEGDIFSFAEFIRIFCIHFDRWNCPKYLLGASYGTARACGLSESLIDTGVYLNGIVLLSCALDYTTIVSQRDLALADCLRLPTLAATSWFHKKTMQNYSLAEVVEYARKFSFEEYMPVMLQPNRYSSSQLQSFYQKLSDLIGLPADTLRRYQGRLKEDLYVTEFLAPERKLIGGIDSRYIGDVSAIAGEYIEDPSYQDIRPAFYPAFLNYMQNELETKSQFPKYTTFSIEAFLSWNWWTYDNPLTYPNFMQRLRRSLVSNPAMKVFVGSGYYDIRTPFGAAEYSIDHLELPTSYRNNFQMEYYEAGHAFIFDLASLKKFKQDLVKFYAN